MKKHDKSAVGKPAGVADVALDWVDQRTGLKKMIETALLERIPGGARAAYVFGSGLLFIFLLQVVTGLSLALYYTPTAQTAHTSVAYITKQVAGGAFLRSLHSYGSSAMIIVLGLHFLQTFFFGSFKGRRELLWLSGAFLSTLILGMGFTGYLLPWDQKAYFATAVGTNVAGEVPLIGSLITRLLRGGDTIGTLTLSRFYVAHVFLIPAMIVAFISAHVFLFRKAGPAGPVKEHPVSPRLPAETFYPRQVLLDMGFALLIVMALAALAYLRPVTLGPIADPSDSHFLPRPEWYYLPMFEWLKFWEGPWVVVGIVVIPGLLATGFFLMPFLDRRLERRPWRRPIPALAVAIVVMGMVFLGIKSQIEDHQEPIASQLAQQHQQEQAYSAEPFEPYFDGADGGATTALVPAIVDPGIARGKAIFFQRGCVGCHGTSGQGTSMAPSLHGVTHKFSADQLVDLLHNPNPRMRAAGMPAVDLPSPDMSALLGYLDALGTPKSNVPLLLDASSISRSPRASAEDPAGAAPEPAAPATAGDHHGHVGAGKRLFQERACFACHGAEGKGGRAPALAPLVAKLSDAELNQLLADPNSRMRAGGMAPVDGNDEVRHALIAYLRTLPTPQQMAPPAKESLVLPVSITRESESRVAAPAAPDRDPAPAAVPLTAAVATAPAAALAAPQADVAKVSIDPHAVAGRALFRSQGCVGCHGANAQGTQLAPSLVEVGERYPGDKLPALLRHPTRKMKAGGMPIPAANDAQLADLVSYLRSLKIAPAQAQSQPVEVAHSEPAPMRETPKQTPKQAPKQEAANQAAPAIKPAETPAALAAGEVVVSDPAVRRGQSIFRRNACGTCHGADGLRGTVAAPALAGTASLLSEAALENLLLHHSERMKKGGMPPTNFNEHDRRALISYIRSLPSDAASLDLKQAGPAGRTE